jgi:hypothetical protein
METRCDKCGEPVVGDQAFCPNCGAVVGMADAGAQRDEGELEVTMMGRPKPSAAPPRPATAPRPAYQQQAPQAQRSGEAPAPPSRGGNTALLAVISLVAVLLIGGLLLLLYYLNSQG